MSNAHVSLPRRAWRRTMRLQRRALGTLPVSVSSRLALPGRAYPSFNRQERRREIVCDIAATFAPDFVVETGTWRGGTTQDLSAIFGCRVATVEADRRFYTASSRRLAGLTNITPHLGDSREFLTTLAADPAWRGSGFFYLDAHWEEDLPLAAELEIIASSWPESVILIDDIEVPDDPGYGFDDYGPEIGALTAAELPPVASAWELCYPAAPAATETGARQGCCVLWPSSLPGLPATLRKA